MTEQVSGPQGTKIAGRHMVMAPYSVNSSQVGLKSLGLGLDTNTAGHSLLAVNICDAIMSSFAIG